ncbi:hypothetical protein ACNKHX_20805 [Shigella flexneri]
MACRFADVFVVSNPMPIIMVTAKGEEVDRMVGLEMALTITFQTR